MTLARSTFALILAALLIGGGHFWPKKIFFHEQAHEKSNEQQVVRYLPSSQARSQFGIRIIDSKGGEPCIPVLLIRGDQASLRSGMVSTVARNGITGLQPGKPALEGNKFPLDRVPFALLTCAGGSQARGSNATTAEARRPQKRDDRSNATTAEARRPPEGRLAHPTRGERGDFLHGDWGFLCVVGSSDDVIHIKTLKLITLGLMGASSTSVSVRHIF